MLLYKQHIFRLTGVTALQNPELKDVPILAFALRHGHHQAGLLKVLDAPLKTSGGDGRRGRVNAILSPGELGERIQLQGGNTMALGKDDWELLLKRTYSGKNIEWS